MGPVLEIMQGFVLRINMRCKKLTLVLLILFCFALLACDNPYDIIKDQKKKIDDLTAKLAKANLESQEKCAQRADKVLKDMKYGKDMIPADYVCHYNKKLNICFMEMAVTSVNQNGSVSTLRNLFDAFEGKEYASLFVYVPKGQAYYEVKPQNCKMLDNFCKSEDEYKAFIKKYMEE
jgi:hypothetical protein